MPDYEASRQQYRPSQIKLLLIAESPPTNDIHSSRQFYRTDKVLPDDRLFNNTIKALYPATTKLTTTELQAQKQQWLRKFQADGRYMIEALEIPLPHEVTKQQRQELLKVALPRLVERVKELAKADAKIILIKSNVFEVAAEPLREAGFVVLNKELVDYPGHFNQAAYRTKLARLAAGL